VHRPCGRDPVRRAAHAEQAHRPDDHCLHDLGEEPQAARTAGDGEADVGTGGDEQEDREERPPVDLAGEPREQEGDDHEDQGVDGSPEEELSDHDDFSDFTSSNLARPTLPTAKPRSHRRNRRD
jgi:hypothetical protein